MPRAISAAKMRELLLEVRDRRRFRVPPSKATPKRLFISCHYCSYSPDRGVPKSGVCPKCGGSSWERYALSRRLVPPHMR